MEDGTKKKVCRVLRGTVVSTRMQKTIVVQVERKFRHPFVGKVITSLKTYKAHDEHNSAKEGDVVDIAECRPLSRTKHMTLQTIIAKETV